MNFILVRRGECSAVQTWRWVACPFRGTDLLRLSAMGEQRLTKQRKLLAMVEDDVDDDRFSSLLEPLIHHILSFLPLREVMKASLVCKPWNRACSSSPILDFHSEEFVDKDSLEIRKRLERMTEFVDATMTRIQEQHFKIDRFNFHYKYFPDAPSGWVNQIEKWIRIALDNNVEEISIVNDCWDYCWYSISERCLSAPSVTSLELSGGNLALHSTSNASMNLKSLQSLTLDCFSVDDRTFERLMSACYSLKFLSVANCNIKKVKVSGLCSIKRVHLKVCKYTSVVEIEAPSLESLHYECVKFEEKSVISVIHCPNLKSLKLVGVANTDDWFQDFLSKFPALEDLTLDSCNLLRRISILNPLTKSVVIKCCTKLMDINLENPELTQFNLIIYDGAFPSIRMKTPRRYNCMAKLSFFSFQQVEPGWSCKLREFLTGPCKFFRSLSLCVSTPDFVLNLGNAIGTQWLGAVACNEQYLGGCPFVLSSMPETVNVNDINGFLWTPHPTTVTVVVGLSGDDFLQIFCEKVAERQSCSGHNCPNDVECSSYLDEKIEIVTGSNYKGPVGRNKHTIWIK